MRPHALAALILAGCTTCGPFGEIHETGSSMTVRLIASVDSLDISYDAHGYATHVAILETLDPSLGDTVKLTFHGVERFYESRLMPYIRVDSSSLVIAHGWEDSMHVVYETPRSSIEVLRKEACSPVDPAFRADSVRVFHAPRKAVSVVIK